MIIFHLLHLWIKFITFMVSQIITFMFNNLLHLWSVSITFMVGISIMVDFYWLVLHLW